MERLRPNTWDNKIVSGVPSENFTRKRPSTWNLSYVTSKHNPNEKNVNDKVVGKTKEKDPKDVYFDKKLNLFYHLDSMGPNGRMYVRKNRINFVTV